MHNPSWPWPTRVSSSGSIPWLAALTMTAIGMLIAAAWPTRPPRPRKRAKRSLPSRLRRDATHDEASDDDGVTTGEYHAIAPSSGTPATHEPPLEAEHLVGDAPGTWNYDRRHTPRPDDERIRPGEFEDAV